MKQSRTVQLTGGATESTMRVDVRQDNTPVAMLAKFVRSLPPEQRGFFKECRIVGFYPVYMPEGMFQANEHLYSLDPDQLDYLVDNTPEFRVADDTGNNHLVTGRKIMVGVN